MENKGISVGKIGTGDTKYRAQYWNKDLKTTVYIGSYDTEAEAIAARKEFINNLF